MTKPETFTPEEVAILRDSMKMLRGSGESQRAKIDAWERRMTDMMDDPWTQGPSHAQAN